MQTVDRIVDVLEEAGIDHVFGLPGGDTGRIFKALYAKQDKIKVVVARDEQTAACMADMYGRLTGKPGVFMAQGCYAASTGLFGVIEAGLGSSPMLVITDITTYGVPPGHGSLQCGGGEYGNFDIAAIFKATCKFTAVAHSPGEGVQALQRAIKHATTGRPGPTAVVLAIGALQGDITAETFPRIYDTRGYMQNTISVPPASETERAADLLLTAKLLHPERQCVSVSSDGFAMQSHVLTTALQYDAPVTYVVLNDAQLGMVRQGQGDEPIASEFVRTDWASVAEGYGAVGLRVQNPAEVQSAVREALSGQKPAVVDVSIDPNEPMQERLRSTLGVYGSY